MIETQWAKILPAPDGTAWRVKTLRKLTPVENRGSHHIFIYAEKNGSDIRGDSLAVRWGWEGMDEPPHVAFLNKPSNEPATNIPMMPRMIVWFEICDLLGVPSDRVIGLHTDYPDEAQPSDGMGGNTLYHHSFEVRMALDAEDTAPPGDVLTGLVDVKAQLHQALNQVDGLIQMVGEL